MVAAVAEDGLLIGLVRLPVLASGHADAAEEIPHLTVVAIHLHRPV